MDIIMCLDDILREIFVRLPTKSLMRFKCVSKHWNSIIRDPFLAKKYVGGFHGFLITTSRPYSEVFCNTSNFDSENNKLENIQESYRRSLEGDYNITNIVKGLYGMYNDGEFKLCNIATREVLNLPIISEEEIFEFLNLGKVDDFKASFYQIGFEPVSEIYKVFRLFFYDGGGEDHFPLRVHLQICTLGEGGNELYWRNIDIAPKKVDYGLCYREKCINGILYLKFNDDCIVAIDLRTETSSNITLPQGYSEDRYKDDELGQLGGSLAVIYGIYSEAVGIIWILKDDGTWMKRCVDLVSMGKSHVNPYYVGTLPTGEMLLQELSKRDIYVYDHIQNKLSNWIRVGNGRGYKVKICYHEDNIVPLDSLITRACVSSPTCRLFPSLISFDCRD